jgi:hypothetical protein
MIRHNPQRESFIERAKKLDTIDVVSNKFLNVAFDFQFFDKTQVAGQDFSDWSPDQILKLIDKIKGYCKETLAHWNKMPVGQGRNHVLEIYGTFPAKSEFTPPLHVPIDAKWARFRLEGDMRLIGFVVPNEKCEEHKLPKNIFYVVFLDAYHKFFKK